METPILRLELSGLRYQVVHALMTHNRETEEQVGKAVAAAVESFDFEMAVRREATNQLTEAIKSAVAHAIYSLFNEAEVRLAVQNAVTDSLLKIERGKKE